MKRIIGCILALSIMLNSGIAAFCAVMPDFCAKPTVAGGSSPLTKLFSSVLTPLQDMDNSVQNDNPFVPNLLAAGGHGSAADNTANSIIVTMDNKPLNFRQCAGSPQAACADGYNPEAFAGPLIFPPPGPAMCVNSLYLKYFVFLAKANLPWEINFPNKG